MAAPLFDDRELRKALHRWAGAGGTVGFPRITEIARQAEALLEQPFDRIAGQLCGLLENLLAQFTSSPAAAGSAAAVANPSVAVDASARKPLILICDDDPVVVRVIQSTLEAGGMVCRTTENGRLACAMALQSPFDAMVLDIDMPALDGFQVLEELRRAEATRHLKVMLLTARHETENITRGVYCGADDYMVKPFDPAQLVERMKVLLAAPAVL
jgi:CheY-like chemotaxis protein